MLNIAEMEDHAKRMAEIASDAAMHYFRGTLGVEFKSDESPVTQADKGVEAKIWEYIKQHFPDHGIFGEEHGKRAGNGQNMWVIDPIDGTRSFLSGHPLFGFLLAHLVNGQAQLGVIGMPALNETFMGIKGQGATLNGVPINVSQTTQLDRSILYVNEGDKIYTNHPAVFDRLMKSGQTRRFAYDCYPHALLAAGHVDAVVDYDLQPYDFLAVSPVIEAAGGLMTDWQGNPLTLDYAGAVVSAATPELHASLLDVLKG